MPYFLIAAISAWLIAKACNSDSWGFPLVCGALLLWVALKSASYHQRYLDRRPYDR